MIALHHFTSLANWERIRRAGVLALTDSHVHPRKPGAPVVWLTTREDPTGMGLAPNSTARRLTDAARIDKRRVRITVEANRTWTHKWLEWAVKNGGDPAWIAHVRSEIPAVGSWRVCTKTISREQWLECVDLHTGEHLSIAPTLRQLGFKKLYTAQR